MEAISLHGSQKTRAWNRNLSGVLFPPKTSLAQEILRLTVTDCKEKI